MAFGGGLKPGRSVPGYVGALARVPVFQLAIPPSLLSPSPSLISAHSTCCPDSKFQHTLPDGDKTAVRGLSAAPR